VKAKLKSTVYLKQVKGFEKHGREHQVWKLLKALYGLRQAGATWHAEINTFLQSIGLKPSAADKCLYYERGDHGLCNGAKGNRYVSFRCGVEEAMSWALGQDTWNYKQN
jgi:hypothetical protein